MLSSKEIKQSLGERVKRMEKGEAKCPIIMK